MGRSWPGVRRASESSIEIEFYYRGQRCRERIGLKPTPANLRKANLHRVAILHAIAHGTFDYAATFPDSPRATRFAAKPGDAVLVDSYLADWLEQKEKHVKASTHEGYRKIVNGQLIPAFGRLRLPELTRPAIKSWLSKIDEGREKPLTNKRLSNIQSCLRSALSDALEAELIDHNPLHDWTYSRKEELREVDDIDPFAPDEQAAILAKLRDQTANMIKFAFWTGLRSSELFALQWGDIDYKRGEADIRRALTRAAKGKAESTKTTAGTRRVKLLRPALDALNAQEAHTLLAGKEVFLNPGTREPWTGDNQVWRVWGTALRRAGVRYRNPYQTRHTYASMMLSAGEHPMWVAKQMGHKDWTMIARVYGRWMPVADIDAGSRAEKLFANADQNADQPGLKQPKTD